MNVPSRFRFESPMPTSAEELWSWHARPGAFERLTPPWEPVALLSRSGPRLEDGLRVTLGVGYPPLRLRWVAEHRDCEPGRGFRDVQIAGPFAHWSHHHRMRDAGGGTSVLEDELSVALPLHGLWRPVAEPALERKLGRLFRFRHAITRGDLATHAARPGPPLRIEVGGGGALARALRPFLTTGGHQVGETGPGADPPDAVVLAPGGPGEPGSPLGALVAHHAGALGRAACLIVAGEALPSALPSSRRGVALHLGHLVWPGMGWLRWTRPLPGTLRGSADTRPRRWIGLDDALGAVLTALRDETLTGSVDAAHPEPASTSQLARLAGPGLALPGQAPTAPAAPGGAALLAATGYRFRHADLAAAVAHALGRQSGTPPGPPA